MVIRRATGLDLQPTGADCSECGLQDCILVESYGPEDVDLALVGEAPGDTELRWGRPFVGPAGTLLDQALEAAGIDREQLFLTNAVLCRPDPHRAPTAAELRCCRGRLLQELRARSPRVIVAMGSSALKTLLNKQKLGENRGQTFHSEELDCLVVPTWHTAYALRGRRDAYYDIEHDLQFVQELLANDSQQAQEFHYLVNEPPQLGGEVVVLDIEMSSTGELLCIGLADVEGGPITVINHEHPGGFGQVSTYLKGKRLVAHNAEFEWSFLQKLLGVDMPIEFDTLLGHYVLTSRVGVHSLDELVKKYYSHDPALERWASFKALRDKLEEVELEDVCWYNARDVHYSRLLYHDLQEEMDEGLHRAYAQLINPAIKPLAKMTQRGVYIDQEQLRHLDEKYGQRAKRLEQEMMATVGRELNPRSPQQVAEVLFEELGLDDLEDGSTNINVLKTLREEHGFVEQMIEYRRVQKMHSTYVRGIKKRLVDGRIHGRFNLAGTATGRLSSSGPNLQNIPKHKGEESREVRGLFRATPGYTWVSADVSQAELRCLAYYCQDSRLLEAISSGTDLHAGTSRALFDIRRKEPVPKELRNLAKTLNFAIVYGASPDKVMETVHQRLELDLSYGGAQHLIDRWFNSFPKVGEWITNIRAQVIDTGEVRTPMGRRRRWPVADQDALREAVNNPIQALASDIVLKALIYLDEELPETDKLLITVHDELDLETTRDPIKCGREVRELMLQAAHELTEYMVPFEVDVEIGTRWNDLQEVDVT